MSKLVGKNCPAYLAFESEAVILTGDGVKTTSAGKGYLVMSKAAIGSGIPDEIPVFSYFEAPQTGAQPVLAVGDVLMELQWERYCKTSASFNAEMGSVDVGDDCDPGATIPDGVTNISGDLGGIFRIDDTTGEPENVTAKILNRFMPFTTGDGEGTFDRHEVETGRVFLIIYYKKAEEVGGTSTYVFTPITITSASSSLGMTDPVNRDISWSKGEGEAGLFSIKKTA